MYLYQSKRPTATDDVFEDEIVITKPAKDHSVINGNDIYFYSDVNLGSIFSLNKTISDLEKQMLITQINLGLAKPPHINLFINSDGGEIFSAFTTVDRIKACKVPVHTHVEGIVASAASLISVCGTKRTMGKTAVMLVHQLRSWCGGTHENLKDEAKNLDLLAQKIKAIYLEHTNFTENELDELLKHDIYLTAEDCLKHGLIDKIV
jgi:ATP-dependent protease ClpP protease subunit